MPDNLRVVPWEQFNTYNQEIMEKVESLDTTNANENDVLTYTGNNITWQAPVSELPSGGMAGDILTWSGDTFEWVKGLPEGADGETNSKVLTYTGGTGKYSWESPLPSTYNANDGDVLTYSSDSGYSTWKTPYPPTNNASSGDVLSYNGNGFEWTAQYPSINNASEGDVLTYTGSNFEWATPQSELPSTDYASEGDVLTYNGSTLEWVTPSQSEGQSEGLPETPSDQPALLTTDPSGSLSWLPAEGSGGHYTSGIPYVQCDGHFHWIEQPSVDGQYVLVVQSSDSNMRYFWEPYNN